MSDTFLGFTVDSSLAYPADSFTVEVVPETRYLSASAADRVALEAGLLDALNNAQTVTWLRGGVIDDYELVLDPDSSVVSLRGRNAMARLIDRTVRYRFLRTPRPAIIEALPVDTTITQLEGQFTAKQVAGVLARAAGFELVWECHNYTLMTDFDAMGPVLNTLLTLIGPLNLVEPFKVDLVVENAVLYVRQRPGLSIGADITIPITDTAISTLSSRKRRLPVYGRVTLLGASTSTAISEITNVTGGGAGLPPTGSVITGGELDIPSDYPIVDPKTGVTIGRSIRVDRYRMPDLIFLRSTTTEYGLNTTTGSLQPIKQDTVVNKWEDSVYDATGPINQPKQLRQVSETSSFVESTTVFTSTGSVAPASILVSRSLQPTTRETILFGYDAKKFLRYQVTTKEAFDSATKTMKPNAREVQAWINAKGTTLTEHTTHSYTLQTGVTDKGVAWSQWTLFRRSSVFFNGPPPGGVQPPLAQQDLGSGDLSGYSTSTRQQLGRLRLEETISTDADAVDVTVSTDHFLLADLRFLMAQYRAASGIWESEQVFDGAALVYLRKGRGFALSGITGADGTTPIPFPPALAYEIRLRCEAESQTASVRALSWAA